ncbi:type II/III secretion system family protein [Paraburkholderia sp. NMBU_R16]|uniref:type II/III secretion system family protein n=1 Tax=Paraburkholderia sp. NMBU_R16 TaxID=2698676 RepID=UPI0015650122|nr:type II/III secretion system family protein [Paraburkholderia sp. NMBU_R16]NRO98862.1 type II/III secretion system family protein [Paraburkholderia sp. NMBU_R16]
MRSFVRRVAAAALFTVATHSVANTSIPWSESHFVYTANGNGVTDTLKLFADVERVTLSLSGDISGTVSGRFAMAPQKFLDEICRANGLVWYYDGAVLHVSPLSEQARIAIRPNFMSADALHDVLIRSGLINDRFPIVVDKPTRTVVVGGPTEYVQRIRAAAAQFEGDRRARQRTAVRVFRLSVATAADKTLVVDGRTTRVPGAAALLQQRFHRDPPSADAIPNGATELLEFDAPLPIVEADAATNSILIRDKPERIEGDGILVSDVDTRAQTVAIEATVIDVDQSALQSSALTLPTGWAEDNASNGRIVVLDDDGRTLMAQFKRLEQSNLAQQTLSRLAVTVDHAPAIVDRRTVMSSQAADESDNAPEQDLWLSVTPSITGPAQGSRIDLHIEFDEGGGVSRMHADASVVNGAGTLVETPIDGNHRRFFVLVARIVA